MFFFKILILQKSGLRILGCENFQLFGKWGSWIASARNVFVNKMRCVIMDIFCVVLFCKFDGDSGHYMFLWLSHKKTQVLLMLCGCVCRESTKTILELLLIIRTETSSRWNTTSIRSPPLLHCKRNPRMVRRHSTTYGLDGTIRR